MSDSLRPHGLQPARLLCPWDSRREYWSGLPSPSLGELPDTGIKPESLMSPGLAGKFLTTGATWEPQGSPQLVLNTAALGPAQETGGGPAFSCSCHLAGSLNALGI